MLFSKTSLLLFTLASIQTTLSAVLPPPVKREDPTKVGYLFLHFYDNYLAPGEYTTYPAGEQVFGHVSKNNSAIDYSALKGGAPLLTSTVGTKAVRDLYLVSKPDESQHWIIGTDLNQTAVGGFGGSFLSRNLVIWDSVGSSLTQWSESRLAQVVPDNFRMAWAPESLWDDDKGQFMVYWSSNTYADASHSGSPSNDKIWYSYTSDFVSFTDPQIYIDLGNVGVIDLTMHPTGVDNQFVRFFKDESVSKCRGQVSNNGLFGDWEDIGSDTEYVDNNNQSEACLFFEDNQADKWWVFLDQYGRNPAGYYPWSVNNKITDFGYTDVGFPPGMPTLLKHGVVKPLTQAQLDDVNNNWG